MIWIKRWPPRRGMVAEWTKIAYLNAAIDAVRNNVPIIGLLLPPPEKKPKG